MMRTRPGRASTQRPSASRHHADDFLRARVHELGDMHDLIVCYADLRLETREARGAGLQVGDADDVVVGHGAGEIFRGLRRSA